MDQIDLKILRELLRDGRLSMSDLAKRVHLSRAHVYRRVESLRETGVIRGFTTDVDANKVGLPVSALILLQAEQDRWPELNENVQSMPRVEFAGATTGEFDVAVLARAESVESLREVVLGKFALMDAVRTTRTLIVLEELIAPRPILPDM